MPVRLCPFYDWFIIGFETGLSLAVALGAAILGLCLALVTRGIRRSPVLALGLLWVLLALAPVSQIIPIIVVTAERFLYLPMLGVVLVAGLLLQRGLARARAAGWGKLAAAAVAVVLLGYATRTLVRPWLAAGHRARRPVAFGHGEVADGESRARFVAIIESQCLRTLCLLCVPCASIPFLKMTMKQRLLLACCGGLLATACGNSDSRQLGGRAVPDAAPGVGPDAARDVGRDVGPDVAFDAGVDVAAGQSADAGGGTRATGWADDRVRALVAQMTYAEKIVQLQNTVPAIPRLGLAGYQYWNEGLHGVLTNGATSFPQAIALASTWDPDLLHRVASAISDEARGFNAKSGTGLTYWSPVINMLRDPRWGRFEESYSEDPFLMARMGVAFVKGLQGDDPKYLKAVATPKHFAGNNSEYNRHNGSSDIDEQLLHEYYLPAFEATVVEAGAFSVMSAYNRVNGVPSAANPLLLHDILRDAWGFQGYVVSDCDAIWDIANGHHWTSTTTEAAAKALLAGTDLNCGETYPKELQAALDQGLVTESDVDAALVRVLRARFLLGEFDSASEVAYRSIGAEVIESQANTALALEAARAAIVLLKNDGGLLPLDRRAVRSIAVIGPHGDDVTLGGYSGNPDHRVSALDGIRAKFPASSSVTVTYQRGCSITGSKDQSAIDAAADLASKSNVAVVLVGTSQDVLCEEMDRPDWNLPGAQGDLIQAVFTANPHTIVVLVTAGPVAVDWAQARVPAILTAFYDGQEQGTAIADALFGDFNPGGKLTTTWYTGSTALPPIGDYDLRKGRTYLYYNGSPLYPFGFGLSYTTFAYANFAVAPTTISPIGSAAISVDVSNTGSRSGDEVVQLYAHDTFASVPRPIKELRGFRRIHLEPGQSQKVTFTLAAKDLAFWDVTRHAWRVEDGVFDIAVGSSSADIRAQGSLVVASAGDASAGPALPP